MENLIHAAVPLSGREANGVSGSPKVDFRIKIWIKINVEKLKCDSLVIYMTGQQKGRENGISALTV